MDFKNGWKIIFISVDYLQNVKRCYWLSSTCQGAVRQDEQCSSLSPEYWLAAFAYSRRIGSWWKDRKTYGQLKETRGFQPMAVKIIGNPHSSVESSKVRLFNVRHLLALLLCTLHTTEASKMAYIFLRTSRDAIFF